jgi:hypothetical protein
VINKSLAVILSIFALSSCVSLSKSVETVLTPPDTRFLKTVPASDELIFIGVSGPRIQEAEAIQLALEDAAKRVAFFYEVSGKMKSYFRISSAPLDYESSTQSAIADPEDGYKLYIDNLTYDDTRDVLRSNGAVFVRTRYKGTLPHPVSYGISVSSTGKPLWVSEPPQEKTIPGYVMGIGYAGKRSYQSDTIKASYENAALQIITGLFANVRGNREENQGTSNSDEYTVYAEGTLQNFYILDTWLDPSTMGVYTLAIAQDPS